MEKSPEKFEIDLERCILRGRAKEGMSVPEYVMAVLRGALAEFQDHVNSMLTPPPA